MYHRRQFARRASDDRLARAATASEIEHSKQRNRYESALERSLQRDRSQSGVLARNCRMTRDSNAPGYGTIDNYMYYKES